MYDPSYKGSLNIPEYRRLFIGRVLQLYTMNPLWKISHFQAFNRSLYFLSVIFAYLELEVKKDEEGFAYTGDPRLSALYTCTVELEELYTGDTASVSADAEAATSDDLNKKSEILCCESQDQELISIL